MVCRYTDPATGDTITSEQSVPAADEPAAGPPPFAGGWPQDEPMVVGATHSREVHIICELDCLDEGSRERVLQYASAKWLVAS